MAEDSAVIVSQVEKPVLFFGLEDVLPLQADLAAIRHSHEFYTLLFFSAIVPVVDDPQKLAGMENVPAKCIARIVLAPSTMERLYEAIGTNMEKRAKLLELVPSHGEPSQGMDSV